LHSHNLATHRPTLYLTTFLKVALFHNFGFDASLAIASAAGASGDEHRPFKRIRKVFQAAGVCRRGVSAWRN
jgi:hypothetical protein